MDGGTSGGTINHLELRVVRAEEDGLRRVLLVVHAVLPHDERVRIRAGTRNPDGLPDDPDDLLHPQHRHQHHHCNNTKTKKSVLIGKYPMIKDMVPEVQADDISSTPNRLDSFSQIYEEVKTQNTKICLRLCVCKNPAPGIKGVATLNLSDFQHKMCVRDGK